MDGWIDELRFKVTFNSILFISGRWKGEHERFCAVKRRLGSEITSAPAGTRIRGPVIRSRER